MATENSIISIKPLPSITDPMPDIVISHGVPFPVGTVGMLIAAGGTGKTMLSMVMAYSFMHIRPWYKVAMWLTEDPLGGIRERGVAIKSWLKSRGVNVYGDPDIITSDPVKFTKGSNGRARLSEEFHKVRKELLKYDVVVIDPLTSFNGGDENNNDDAREFMDALNAWARRENKVILMIHHVSKDTNNGVKGRGASGFTDAARYVIELSYDKNMKCHMLAIQKENYGLTKYWASKGEFKTIQVIPPAEFFPERKPEPEPELIRISTNDYATGAGGYTTRDVYWWELEEIVKSKGNYSASVFANAYRNGENALPGQDLMILDFDEGLDIDDARQMFSQYKAMISTSRNHRKDKDGLICDRFRVIIPTSTRIMLEYDDYAAMMNEVYESFVQADTTCGDMARMYFGNPNSEVEWTGGNALFDWKPFWTKAQARREYELREHETTKHEYEGNPEMLDRAYETFMANHFAKTFRNKAINRLIWIMKHGDCLEVDEVCRRIRDLNSRSRDICNEQPLPITEIDNLLRPRSTDGDDTLRQMWDSNKRK